MSRYYKIDINNGQYVFTNKRADGTLDPGGLRVEIDVQAAPMAAPTGQSMVTVWGVPLQPTGNFPGISQASNLNNLPVTVSGGMQKGLPLASADANQAGVLIKGVINQAYGNWMDVAQSLVLVITSDGGATQAAPANIVVNWKKGAELSAALQQTLSTAYPKLKLDVHITKNLVLQSDEVATYSTIQQLAAYVKKVSAAILGGTYSGVDIWINNDVIDVYDNVTPDQKSALANTQSTTPQAGGTGAVTTINFVDLIGQPTWLDAFTISFSVVMRGDLTVGSQVKLPEISQLQSITSPQSLSLARNKSAFTGTWGISMARHVGDSRAPTAMSWISVFQAYSNLAPQAATSPANTSA